MYTMLRARRLRWTGHVCRQGDTRLPKNIFYSELAASPRPRGRPKLRYRDVLKRDLTAFDIPLSSWEEMTQERLLWRDRLQRIACICQEVYRVLCHVKRRERRYLNIPVQAVKVFILQFLLVMLTTFIIDYDV